MSKLYVGIDVSLRKNNVHCMAAGGDTLKKFKVPNNSDGALALVDKRPLISPAIAPVWAFILRGALLPPKGRFPARWLLGRRPLFLSKRLCEISRLLNRSSACKDARGSF